MQAPIEVESGVNEVARVVEKGCQISEEKHMK